MLQIINSQLSRPPQELRKSSEPTLSSSATTGGAGGGHNNNNGTTTSAGRATGGGGNSAAGASKCYEDSQHALERLQFHDWARLWIQVIRELRHGVKLKKVDALDDFDGMLHHHREYELTPYEMLLDDIRARRYKLNKVMINGDLPPRLKKDAHELILDFIRSRPPLVPVAKRVLRPPPPKESTLYERLMDQIRQEHKLKPTPTRPRSVYGLSMSAHTTPAHRRK